MMLSLVSALVVTWAGYDPVKPEVPGVVLAFGAGYGGAPTGFSCLSVQDADVGRANDCGSMSNGMALSAGLGVLWGDVGRFGMRVDGSFVPFGNGDRSALGSLLAVARYDRTMVVEAGLGGGYSYFRRDVATRGAGIAGHLLVGVHVSRPLSIFSRALVIAGEPGGLVAGVGVEWSL